MFFLSTKNYLLFSGFMFFLPIMMTNMTSCNFRTDFIDFFYLEQN